MGHHADGLKFAGGSSSSLFLEDKLRELIDLAHEYDGGWVEYILTQSDAKTAVDRYLNKCKSLDMTSLRYYADFCRSHRKPEIGIQFGAGGDTEVAELESMGTSDPSKVVNFSKRFIGEGGVERIMIESEGITENVTKWRTDVI
ncbi:hypothetical protein OQA88_8178 [Cercophora sp. LCS_1]